MEVTRRKYFLQQGINNATNQWVKFTLFCFREEAEKHTSKASKQESYYSKLNTRRKVDFISFLVFPLCFITYNIVYWHWNYYVSRDTYTCSTLLLVRANTRRQDKWSKQIWSRQRAGALCSALQKGCCIKYHLLGSTSKISRLITDFKNPPEYSNKIHLCWTSAKVFVWMLRALQSWILHPSVVKLQFGQCPLVIVVCRGRSIVATSLRPSLSWDGPRAGCRVCRPVMIQYLHLKRFTARPPFYPHLTQ